MDLAIKIVRFVDGHQPGWVECEFVDADSHRHTLVDKVPVFTAVDLDANSVYPQPGKLRCEVLSRSQDTFGRNVVRITTVRPYDIESTEGLSEFVVRSEQLSSA